MYSPKEVAILIGTGLVVILLGLLGWWATREIHWEVFYGDKVEERIEALEKRVEALENK